MVLMHNSGMGSSVNAIASLVVPYRIPLLLVVGLSKADTDQPTENQILRRLTRKLPGAHRAGRPAVRGCQGADRRIRARRSLRAGEGVRLRPCRDHHQLPKFAGLLRAGITTCTCPVLIRCLLTEWDAPVPGCLDS